MAKLGAHPFLGAIVLGSVSISWTPFHSSLYPYSISQPSSFKHVVLTNTANQQVDYFFPSLGSYTTNVNIVAVPGNKVQDEVALLKESNGHNIHRSVWLTIMGRRVKFMHATFSGLAGSYAIDQARFVYNHMVWQLTASYASKYRKAMRPLMLRMLASFRINPPTSRVAAARSARGTVRKRSGRSLPGAPVHRVRHRKVTHPAH